MRQVAHLPSLLARLLNELSINRDICFSWRKRSPELSNAFRLEPFWKVILKEFDLSAETLARRAGLPANYLTSDPVMVDVTKWAALWQALDDEIDEPDLAVRLGQMMTLDMFDPAHFAAFCSKNLRQAAKRLQLYKRLTGPCRLDIIEEPDLGLSSSVHGISLPPELYGAGELVVWLGLVRHATRHHVTPKRIVMPTDPRDPAGFERYFGRQMTRGPRYEIVFEAEDADRVFVTSDASMWAFFEPVLKRRLAELDATTSMEERVSAALHERLPVGQSEVGDVAKSIGVSTRTIQRQLKLEGTSYRNVLDQTRKHLAQHYLARTQLTTSEVAFLVGYDDPNSFYPAFRNWTGKTPQAARAELRPPG